MDQHEDDKNKKDSLNNPWMGILITFVIYIISNIILPLTFNISFIFILIIAAVIQIVLIVLSFVKGKKRLGQGLLIGLGISILLEAACFGLILNNL